MELDPREGSAERQGADVPAARGEGPALTPAVPDAFAFLVARAKELGATAAALIPAAEVVVDERVRLKCAVPACRAYGRYLHCPPNTLSLPEFRAALARYAVALVVQVASSRDSRDLDGDGLARADVAALREDLHGDSVRALGRIVTGLETAAFKAGYPYAAGFTGGACPLCPECVGVGSGEPCRHPFEARPAMEGMGIDVVQTAARAGLPLSLSSDAPVRWTGLLLVD